MTDQHPGIADVEIYEVPAGTDLRAWLVKHTENWTTMNEPSTTYFSPTETQNLKNGIAYDDNNGLRDGTHKRYFLHKNLIIGFGGPSSFDKNQQASYILSTFKFTE